MASNKASKARPGDRYSHLHDGVAEMLPQVYSVITDESDFNGLVLKPKPDGTVLGVLKSYGADGAPMVCFGSGYGALGALLGLEAAVAANTWRVDKPWDPGTKANGSEGS